MSGIPDEIRISDDGTTLPVIELLTGRGFVTGKSGSGKSNTASVIAEELLELDLPLLIIDTDGEYYGLKERYEMLHVGAGDLCDVQVSPTHAQRIATLALEENVPVILDVSEYLDVDEARDLIHGVVKTLFVREKKAKKPFMLLVEECHEYLPESGGLDEVGEILLQVAKRGRKRGLGLCGMSQRPAAVDKDFITQCDWLVWHRLTWENDTKVVGRFLDDEYAGMVEELNDGEAILVTDWDEEVNRVQFRRKKTFDAGATPGLEDVERPDFRTISADLEAELQMVDPSAEVDDSTSNGSGGDSGTQTASPDGVRITEDGDADADGDDAGDADGGSAAGDGAGGAGETDTRPRSSTADSGAMTGGSGTNGGSGGGSSLGSGSTTASASSTAGGSRRSSRASAHREIARKRRRRRRNREPEDNIVLEASHLVAYGVESVIWRLRYGVFRVRFAVRRALKRSRERTRRAGRRLGVDPRLLAALLLGSAALFAGLFLLTVAP
ncbi:ATP-binding protein [Halorarum halobium]|uniref:ATP-binding protein n=1 Tax=Halorarum halobium TaxID=3075121 RepID=UPI003CCD06C3